MPLLLLLCCVGPWGLQTARAGVPLEQALHDVGAGADDTNAGRVRAAVASDTLRSQVWLVAPPLSGASGLHFDVPLARSARWHARLGLGTRAQGAHDGNAEGSELAWRFDASELYALVERRHWGPGRAGSLILDGAAEALPALGWRRPQARTSAHALLRWLGPWRGDLFVGALTGHGEPQRPFLIGMRLEAQPLAGLRLGLSRTMQWGGRGRPENGTSLLRALLGIDNIGDGVSRDDEPGNQLAGVDWRATLWPQRDLGWYGQVIGEDEAGYLPSRNFVLTGVDMKWAGGKVRTFIEWADTLAGGLSDRPHPGVTYRHPIYREGYTHDRRLLGHPIGGDVELGSAGLVAAHGPLSLAVAVGRGRALATAQRFEPGRLEIVNAVAEWSLAPGLRAGAGAWWLRNGGRRDGSVQVWWQYAWP